MRGLIAGGVFLTPLIGDKVPGPLIAIMLGVLLAYDGLESRVVFWTFVLLMAAELSWGIGLGIVSLAYLAAALVLRMAQRFVALTPLCRERSWALMPLVRSTLTAVALAGIMVVGSAAVRSGIYRQGGTVPLTALNALGSPILIILLYRIDVPFRRRISFGI